MCTVMYVSIMSIHMQMKFQQQQQCSYCMYVYINIQTCSQLYVFFLHNPVFYPVQLHVHVPPIKIEEEDTVGSYSYNQLCSINISDFAMCITIAAYWSKTANQNVIYFCIQKFSIAFVLYLALAVYLSIDETKNLICFTTSYQLQCTIIFQCMYLCHHESINISIQLINVITESESPYYNCMMLQ